MTPRFPPCLLGIISFGSRRSFCITTNRPAAKAKSRPNPKTPNPPTWRDQVKRPTMVEQPTLADDKVMLREVKKKVLELLEEEGPMTRRKMYDDHLTKMFPTAPFAPNPPPRPLWQRAQYSPEEDRVYLTMSKLKKRLIGSLTQDGTVAVMTVNKIRLLVAEMDDASAASSSDGDTLTRKSKMERVCKEESEKTFVWILESWVKVLKQKYSKRVQHQAILQGGTAPTRFKAA